MRPPIRILLLFTAATACATAQEADACSDESEASALSVVGVEVDGEPFCLGTAINASWIVTAKHCVQPPGAAERLAPARLHVRDRDGSERAIAEVSVPAGAYESLGQLTGHDIALLRRTSDAETAGVLPSEHTAEEDDDACVVVADDQPTPVPVLVRAVESLTIYADGITCPGDSGGPLLDVDGGLLGIASWRTLGECGSGTSVFTRVDAHREWMAEVMAR